MLHRVCIICAIVLGGSICAEMRSAAQEIDQVCASLRSPIPTERAAALLRLAKLPAERVAIEPMMQAISDPSITVRRQALDTWGRVGGAYDDLVYAIHRHRHSRSDAENAAEEGAWQDWQKRLLASIEPCLTNGSPDVQKAALHCLSRLYRAVDTVCPLRPRGCILPPPGISLEEKVTVLLQRFAEAHPRPLIAMTRESDPQSAFCGASILAATKQEGITAILAGFLTHSDPVWRMIGCNCLSRKENALRLLMPLLADEDARVRWCAILSIGEPDKMAAHLACSFPASSVPLKRSILLMMKYVRETKWKANPLYASILQGALADADGDVVADALATRLERLMVWEEPHKQPAPPYLLRLLSHPYGRVRAEAARLLCRVTPKSDVLDRLLGMLRDPETVVREELIWLLEEQTDARLPREMIAAYRLGAEQRTYAVACSLAKSWDVSERLVRSLLHDSDSRMRALAINVLGQKKLVEYVPWMSETAQDTSGDVRRAVAKASRGWPEALPAALLLLEDRDPEVRKQAMESFSETDKALAHARLLELTRNPDRAISREASKWLEWLED